ncbi:MAG: hypothetical protein O2960_28470 [Verrucomicrobia bacterium]|nr:hypothetical protein [Verrucomicrobiota bacterium]
MGTDVSRRLAVCLDRLNEPTQLLAICLQVDGLGSSHCELDTGSDVSGTTLWTLLIVPHNEWAQNTLTNKLTDRRPDEGVMTSSVVAKPEPQAEVGSGAAVRVERFVRRHILIKISHDSPSSRNLRAILSSASAIRSCALTKRIDRKMAKPMMVMTKQP